MKNSVDFHPMYERDLCLALYTIKTTPWHKLPTARVRYLHSILNLDRPEYRATLEALTAYLAYKTLRYSNPNAAKRFATETVTFWPFLLLDDEEMKWVVTNLPPYPSVLDRVLEKHGLYDALSSYLKQQGIEISRAELKELVIGRNWRIAKKVKDEYCRKHRSLGRIARYVPDRLWRYGLNLLINRNMRKIAHKARENLEIEGADSWRSYLAFWRGYLPVFLFQLYLYKSRPDDPLNVMSALISSYLAISTPLTYISYKLKERGVEKARLLDYLKTFIWLVRSPIMAIETMIEMKVGSKYLQYPVEVLEKRGKLGWVLGEVIQHGRIPLGPYVLTYLDLPDGRGFVKRRTSVEEMKNAVLQALEDAKRLGIFPQALIDLTREDVEHGVIPVRKLTDYTVGKTARTVLVTEKELAELYLPIAEEIVKNEGLDESPNKVAATLVLSNRDKLLPFPFEEEGTSLSLERYWYKIEVSDMVSGDLLKALATKEVLALLFLRVYEQIVNRIFDRFTGSES